MVWIETEFHSALKQRLQDLRNQTELVTINEGMKTRTARYNFLAPGYRSKLMYNSMVISGYIESQGLRTLFQTHLDTGKPLGDELIGNLPLHNAASVQLHISRGKQVSWEDMHMYRMRTERQFRAAGIPTGEFPTGQVYDFSRQGEASAIYLINNPRLSEGNPSIILA